MRSGETYSLFGATLQSGFPFAARLAPGEPPHDLAFAVSDLGLAPGWDQTAPIFTSPIRDSAGRSAAELYDVSDGRVLRVPERCDFLIRDRRISAAPTTGVAAAEVEQLFLGPAMSLWLDWRGLVTLHASAVVVGAGAFGFLGASGGGKTAIAAALLLAGGRLLADDLLALSIAPEGARARAAFPEMRMWPDLAGALVAEPEGLERLRPDVDKRRVPIGSGGFGSFQPVDVPLRALCLPLRGDSDGGLRIEPVSGAAAALEVVRHAFSPYSAEALDLHQRRLEMASALCSRVPVCRLTYPPGLDRLRDLGAEIAETLDGLESAATGSWPSK